MDFTQFAHDMAHLKKVCWCDSAAVCLHVQAPLQNRSPDWTLGSKGCYNEATLHILQQQLAADLGSIADGNASGCLSLPVPTDVLSELRQETMRCKPEALGAIMADHTQLDWRPVLPLLQLPCLNLVGGCR
jgi:hypothetical protein